MKKVLTLLLLSSLAAPVLADECALVIEGNDAMQYNLKEMSVPATCKEVTVTLNHTGKLPVANMGHNWVLANTAGYQAVATAGMMTVATSHSESKLAATIPPARSTGADTLICSSTPTTTTEGSRP